MRRFLCAIKELRSNSSAQKMWRRKNAQRAQARLGFFVAQAAKAAKRIQTYYAQYDHYNIIYYPHFLIS